MEKFESLIDELQDEESAVAYWKLEREQARKAFDPWRKKCHKIIKRYKDERGIDGDEQVFSNTGVRARFNILWSNIQTLQPALYARTPKPVVERRFKDQDEVGRTASQILERALQFSLTSFDFDRAMRCSRDDYLLCGRGQVWVRYVPHFIKVKQAEAEPVEQQEQVTDKAENLTAQQIAPQEPQQDQEELVSEEVIADYVFWEDFYHDPARVWEECRWVGRDVYMTRDELRKRFSEEIANAVPLTYTPDSIKKQDLPEGVGMEIFQKAVVSELWDKQTHRVYWIAQDFDKFLDVLEDPLGLKNFFPCPRPLLATATNDSLIPVPDFSLYQDQARELDVLTERIAALMPMVRISGIYDAAKPEIQRIFTENIENALVPTNDWPSYQLNGGLKSYMDLVPIDQVSEVVSNLYQIRERVKADLHEITGLSDIVRGTSDPRETATAQQIKGQYANLRLTDRQTEMQRFARDTVALMGEVMSEHFSPNTLAMMSGMEVISDPSAQENFVAAAALLKDDALRTFRIDVETDSTIAVNEQLDKQSRIEFLDVISKFLPPALELFNQVPQLGPAMAETLLFAVRGFRAGRVLEGTIEDAVKQITQERIEKASQAPEPTPEQQKMQAEMQLKQQELELKTQEMQHRMKLEEMAAQHRQALETKECEASYNLKYQQVQADIKLKEEELRSNEALNTVKAAHETALAREEASKRVLSNQLETR